MTAQIIAELIVAAVEQAARLTEILRAQPDWDSLRGRIRAHTVRLDYLLRDAESDLQRWREEHGK